MKRLLKARVPSLHPVRFFAGWALCQPRRCAEQRSPLWCRSQTCRMTQLPTVSYPRRPARPAGREQDGEMVGQANSTDVTAALASPQAHPACVAGMPASHGSQARTHPPSAAARCAAGCQWRHRACSLGAGAGQGNAGDGQRQSHTPWLQPDVHRGRRLHAAGSRPSQPAPRQRLHSTCAAQRLLPVCCVWAVSCWLTAATAPPPAWCVRAC